MGKPVRGPGSGQPVAVTIRPHPTTNLKGHFYELVRGPLGLFGVQVPLPPSGSSLQVGDGTTTVKNITDLEFSGATVTSGGRGIANVSVSAGGGGTVQVPIYLTTPDLAGNAFAAPSMQVGFSNVRQVKPGFAAAVDGTFEGTLRVPQDYSSGGAIILSLVANNTAASKACRFRVSTSVVANGASEDAAYTDESYVNISVPTSANQRFDQSYTLSSTPVAGSTLNVKVTRNGANAADTLTTVQVLVWEIMFQYTSI